MKALKRFWPGNNSPHQDLRRLLFDYTIWRNISSMSMRKPSRLLLFLLQWPCPCPHSGMPWWALSWAGLPTHCRTLCTNCHCRWWASLMRKCLSLCHSCKQKAAITLRWKRTATERKQGDGARTCSLKSFCTPINLPTNAIIQMRPNQTKLEKIQV